MAIIKHHVPVFLMNPLQLFGQGVVVGSMVSLLAILNFLFAGLFVIAINWISVKRCRRAQARGVLPGVERLIGRVAIGVDNIAMNRGTDDSHIVDQALV